MSVDGVRNRIKELDSYPEPDGTYDYDDVVIQGDSSLS